MFGHVFRFELRHHFSRLSTYVYMGAWFLLAWPLVGTEGTAAMLANPPHEIANIIARCTALGFLVISGVFGMAVLRDFEQDTHHVFFTTNLTKGAYLGGRFLGCVVVCLVVLAAIPLGCFLAAAPWAAHQHMAPFRLAAYVQPFLMFMVPAVLAGGAVCFALGALTRNTTVVYLQGVVLMAIYLGAATVARTSDSLWPALLDPFGIATMNAATQGWTLVQRNTELIPFAGVTLWNRLMWCGVGAVALAAVFRWFPFSAEALTLRTASRRRADAAPDTATEGCSPLVMPATAPLRFDGRTTARQFVAFTRLHLRSVITDLPFLAMTLTMVALNLTIDWGPREIQGVTVWPATWSRLGSFGESSLLIVIVTVVYAGELVWKTRALRADQMFDALPTPTWITAASQFTALVILQALMLSLGVALAVASQVSQGFTELEAGLYVRHVFGVVLPSLVPWAAFGLFAQTLLPHKFFAHALVLGLFLVRDRLASWIGSPLLSVGVTPPHAYSAMDGYGPYARPLFWFTLYWLAWAALAGVVAMSAPRRGTDTAWRPRLRGLRARMRTPAIASALVLAAAVVVIASVIRAELRAGEANAGLDNQALAHYERNYKNFEYLPQPKLAVVDLLVDLVPEDRSFSARGTYTLVNRTTQPIPVIHIVSFCRCVQGLSFDQPFAESTRDEALGYRIYRLETPLAPGDALLMTFDMAHAARGFGAFRQETRLLANGTRLDRAWFPYVGYQRELELPWEVPRRQLGLAPREDVPDPDDPKAHTRTVASSDADFITFRATVGTTRDQAAVAPGQLLRHWQENDRQYFTFDTGPQRIPAAFAIFSGRYEGMRRRSGTLEIEVLHDARHRANAQRLGDAAMLAADRLTALLGPPPFVQFRVVEAPRTSPSGLAPAIAVRPEHTAFIARPATTGGVDALLAVATVDLARQWWDTQVQPAFAKGSPVLTEMLAQYSADRVLEQALGEPAARQRARSALDSYLSGRGSERAGEPSLLESGVRSANYLSPKGRLALRAIEAAAGQPAFDEALRRFLATSRHRAPPYPTLHDLVHHLRAALPAGAHPLLADWFERITLFDNRLVSATSRPVADGRYVVTVTVSARKFTADGMGVERDAALDDQVEIAVYGEAPDRPLLIEKQRITQSLTTFEVTVNEPPLRAALDPRLLLIDKIPGDNSVEIGRR